MMTDTKLATKLLNAVWNEYIKGEKKALRMGASPKVTFNGYPILIHAVFTQK